MCKATTEMYAQGSVCSKRQVVLHQQGLRQVGEDMPSQKQVRTVEQALQIQKTLCQARHPVLASANQGMPPMPSQVHCMPRTRSSGQTLRCGLHQEMQGQRRCMPRRLCHGLCQNKETSAQCLRETLPCMPAPLTGLLPEMLATQNETHMQQGVQKEQGSAGLHENVPDASDEEALQGQVYEMEEEFRVPCDMWPV